jgi:thiol-disulfide isomerase/thioredoxin
MLLFRKSMLKLCFAAFFTLLTIFFAVHAAAQTQKPVAPATATTPITPSVNATTLDKKPFELAKLKGKIVLLMFWATDCAVCRDQMPELRENVRGWEDKPFELVLVSVDRSMQDVDSYNAIISQSVPLKQRFTQIWTGAPGYKDNLGTAQLPRNQLPVTFLIDKTGKLVERNNGRIPAAWWDVISDLL